MPKQVTRKIGEIHEVKTVPTFGEKLNEIGGVLLGLGFIIWIITSVIDWLF